MTREQAKQQLIAMGIEEPTKENIDSFLNTINAELTKEKDKTKDLIDKANLADDLQKQIDAINESKLSETEKLQKQIETLTQQNELAQKNLKRMDMTTKLAEKGITGKTATKFLDGLENGFDFEILGQIIAERENLAVQAKIKELGAETLNPNANNDKNGDNSDPIAKMVLSSRIDNKSAEETVNSYL